MSVTIDPSATTVSETATPPSYPILSDESAKASPQISKVTSHIRDNSFSRPVPGGEYEIRVCTFNCWQVPYPFPLGSRDRKLRLERLADQLLQDQYDVVGLQELWSSSDYDQLAERVATVYPYAHYFHAGFTGSGVCVLSRHPIVSTLMNRYSLNGFAHHVHRGDWFGGKVVGMCELEVGEMRVHFYVTHLHAEYNRLNDLYLPHRIAQSFELSQFVRHTSRGADMVILTGDFNMEPDDLGYRLILSNAHVFDAWRYIHGSMPSAATIAEGMTCDRPDNAYTLPSILRPNEGKRLDYVMYKRGRKNVNLMECEIALNKIPGEDINFSDHVGVYARFTVDSVDRQVSTSWEHNRPLLFEALKILGEGEARAKRDRRFFIGLFVVLVLLIIISLVVDGYLPAISPYLSIGRFLLALFIAFCMWYGFLGLTMELKALLGAKTSMEKLLNE